MTYTLLEKPQEVAGSKPLCPNRRWQPDRSSVRPPALVVEGNLLKRGGGGSSHSPQMYKLQGRGLGPRQDRLKAGPYYVAKNGDTARKNACGTSYWQKIRNSRMRHYSRSPARFIGAQALLAGSGYVSQTTKRLHFGLGRSTVAGTVTIKDWPDTI